MKIGELIVELGFKSDTTKLSDFIKSVGNLNMSSVMASLGVGGLYEAARKFVDMAAERAVDMKTFENVTGQSAQKVKAWASVAEQAGVSAGSFESAIKNLQSSITSTRFGNPDQGLLQAYSILNQYGKANIKLTDDLYTQIDKIREGIKRLTPESARYVLNLLHQDESMMNLYKSEQKLYDQRNKQAVTDRMQVEKMMEYFGKAKEFGNTLKANFVDIGVAIGETLAPLAEFATKIMKAVHSMGLLKGIPFVQAIKFIAEENIRKRYKADETIPRYSEAQTGPQGQGHGPINVNSTFHINGNNPEAMKQSAKDAIKETINEAFYQKPPKGF